jgi:hypothetical protein
MRKQYGSTIILGTLSSLLATALYFAFESYFGKPLDTPQKSLLVLFGLIIVLSAISIFGYRLFTFIVRTVIRPKLELQIRTAIEETITKQAEERFRNNLEIGTGIVKVFENFREAETEILEHVKTSRSVRVFLQIGKTVLGGTTSFYDYLGKVMNPDAKIRILYAGLESPYLSERIAYERTSDYKEWKADLDHAINKITNLMEKSHGAIKGRRHAEGYVWRLFIFDDIAYVQPYLYPRDNSDRAPVLKITRVNPFPNNKEENSSSLYKAFANYFDFKWDEYRPNFTSLARLIPPTDVTSVAVTAKYHQFYVFAIPLRYMMEKTKEVPFHGVGGKRHQDEDWAETAKREVLEETGANISLISSGHTHFHTTGAELESVDLEDDPRPYCLYKRTREADPNFAHPEVLWLVGFEGDLMIKSLDELKPRSEIGGLVCLTGDVLLRTLQEKITYREIETAGDGSRVILGSNVNFDLDVRAIPAGLAILVAAAQRPKFLRRL